MDNPRGDGWQSEVLAQQAHAQLERIGRLLVGQADGDLDRLATLVSDDFASDPLRPSELETIYDDSLVTVERARARDEGPPSIRDRHEWIEAARTMASEHSAAVRDVRYQFKITHVEPALAGDDSVFSTRQIFSLAYRTDDRRVEEHATWHIDWQRDRSNESAPPKLRTLRVRQFRRTTTRRGEPLFVDCTHSALAENACYSQQLLLGMNHWLDRMPAYAMLNRFGTPGIALGDVDGDGLDDLYLCQEPGLPNRLFLQNADGTLRDVSRQWGVDWIEDSRSALFVDLDNDGDQDLAVAIFGHIVIAKNQQQRGFVIEAVLAASESTTSLVAADYDGDGRLDLYVCGYAADTAMKEDAVSTMGALARRFVYHDDDNGAANFLYRNQTVAGGTLTFSDVTAAAGLDTNNRRWSFAAAWEDYDDDGDLDLYVANDYGRNNLYQNRIAQGEPRFVDVTAQLGVEDSASGMGVTWGDYDRDGRMDLYVSNMFSAAGSRITSQSKFKPDAGQQVLARFRRFTRGNTLYRNAGSRFEDVSQAAGVTLGRWAWSSRFVDLNNDGWQDLVVANGYLSSDGDTGDL